MSILTYLEVLVFFSFIQWDEFLLVEEHFEARPPSYRESLY
jgi:hypothetical protein